jgi:hypothetical protein
MGAPTAAQLATSSSWLTLKAAATALADRQASDGSIPDQTHHRDAASQVQILTAALSALATELPHDAEYLNAAAEDFTIWAGEGFPIPDFTASLVAFQPQLHRVHGLPHVVVFPMYTQNGSPDRHVEAVLLDVLWPDFIAHLEATDYSNPMFVPVRFADFTAGYDTHAAVLFPETVSTATTPTFTWGAIFADREAARFRHVVTAAAQITKLDLPEDAEELLADQELAQRTFIMWDLIHDRTHMRGDLPFDPFMIKQRMPYFLYSLEELRCDLTTFRETVRLIADLGHKADRTEVEDQILAHAPLVQHAILFDRIFRFPATGTRVRNYDGLGGQLLFSWLHQHRVVHWTDTQLTIDWDHLPATVVALADAIDHLYWSGIDRPKMVHWLAAHDLIASVCAPHPASRWAKERRDLPFLGAPRELVDAVLDDEFPLSMFHEALTRKLAPVIASALGITGVPR